MIGSGKTTLADQYRKDPNFVVISLDCLYRGQDKENMNEVYKIIACIRKESELTIKSNIRVAVNKMWRNANQEYVRKYLRLGETDKPSSKDVAMMVKYYVEKAI